MSTPFFPSQTNSFGLPIGLLFPEPRNPFNVKIRVNEQIEPLNEEDTLGLKYSHGKLGVNKKGGLGSCCKDKIRDW